MHIFLVKRNRQRFIFGKRWTYEMKQTNYRSLVQCWHMHWKTFYYKNLTGGKIKINCSWINVFENCIQIIITLNKKTKKNTFYGLMQMGDCSRLFKCIIDEHIFYLTRPPLNMFIFPLFVQRLWGSVP